MLPLSLPAKWQNSFISDGMLAEHLCLCWRAGGTRWSLLANWQNTWWNTCVSAGELAEHLYHLQKDGETPLTPLESWRNTFVYCGKLAEHL